MINAKRMPKKEFDRPEPLEPGTYPARVVQVIGLGLQPQRPYKGKEKDPAYELRVTYELLDEFLKDKETGEEILDKPRWIDETFALHSLDSDLAKSTKRYLAIDPEMEYDGDWGKVLGSPVMVNIVQNKNEKNNRIYENVHAVSTMRAKEADKAPDLVNEPRVFDPDNPDMEVFYSLPDFLQDMITDNLEFEGSVLEEAIKTHKKGPKDGPKRATPKKKLEGKKQAVEQAENGSEDASDEDDDW